MSLKVSLRQVYLERINMTIKNGDLPAMPVDTAQLYESRCNGGSWELGSLGLTKREQFAAMAMQGLLASLTADDNFSPAQIARSAVLNADALLAELERTKGEVK